MQRFVKSTVALALLLTAACVTVNIYFPAAEVRKDAERVVKEAYGLPGDATQPAPAQPAAPAVSPTSSPSGLNLLGPASAWAQDYQSLSNAATRGAEQQVVANTRQLAPYFAKGNVGLDANGFAVLRSQDGLDLKQLAEAQRLAQQDKAFKQQLYRAKAEAAGTPGKAGEVQRIYAEVWKQYAQKGWWVQDSGGWRQK
ncbi:MAG: DUF1318 domain-containing protein [Desulfovibrionaceae bacterium]